MHRSIRLRGLEMALVGFGALAGGCATTGQTQTPAPAASMLVVEPALRAPSVGLPMHSAPIAALELLEPQAGEQWRLVSADTEGWVRIWADGTLLAAWQAHRGGLADLCLARDGSWYSAGVDGRIHYWPPGATTPGATLVFGRPISALAVADAVLAISDGDMVELWSREAAPKQVWRMTTHSFVTGLAISPGGDIIAAAELRQSALLAGAATHPQAEFIEGEALGIDAEQQAALRAEAELRHPGATADYVEVWMPGIERMRELVPKAPIDRDLGIRWGEGVVVYREIYDRYNAAVIGRRIADLVHVPLELVKPWAFWQGADGNPTAASQQTPLRAGDFRLGPTHDVVALEHFPGWAEAPPARGWRVGEQRELAIDAHHAAIGDAQGNLAVVAWARPAERGWVAPGEVGVDLLTAAGARATLATATLEPRTDYRLWDLDAATHQSVRVEPPWQVELGDAADPKSLDAVGLDMYPSRLALDGAGTRLATASSSYTSADTLQVAVRVLDTRAGGAEILAALDVGPGFELGISQDGANLLAWLPGASARSWKVEDGAWIAGRPAFPGVPRFSSNGHWSAHVSGLERHIVDLRARSAVVALTNDTPPADLGASTLAAVADDGTLVLVQPYGGGTLERITAGGARDFVELPGAATALAWVTTTDGVSVALVGFLDGSIGRLDPDATEVEPIHAGSGGRIWQLTSIAAHAGVFVEHDDRGLTLHRLADRASLELHLADANALTRGLGSGVAAPSSEGLVAVWRGGSAQPPCRVLDGTAAGVVIDDAAIERWPASRGPELFAAFFDHQTCAPAPGPDGESGPDGASGPDEPPADARP